MKELLQKKSVKIALVIIVLLVVMGIVGINVRSAQRSKDYNAHMDAAEKYLTDLDYEQAIAEYTMAFEIDPKEEVVDALEKTYLAYAQTFVDAGDYEKAVSILEEGYEKIGRESLQTKIEEFQVIQEEMLAEEAQTQEQKRLEEEAGTTEALQEEDVKQLVESNEFQEQVRALSQAFSGWQVITDEQMKELCRIKIEILERYRELYPEKVNYYGWLQKLYFLVGEYELCVQIRGELHELYPDNGSYMSYYKEEFEGYNGEHIYDEYGRLIKSTVFSQNGKSVSEYEYGQNGKLIRQTGMSDTGRSAGETVIETSTWEYEYDSEGRLSKMTIVSEGWGSTITESVFEYSEGGFTIYENTEINRDDFHQVDKRTSNYVMNEYGETEMVGDASEVIQ